MKHSTIFHTVLSSALLFGCSGSTALVSCPAGQYDSAGTCSNVGVGYYSTGDSVRKTCTAAPSNASHSSATATEASCPWACDEDYLTDGTACVSSPDAKRLACNSDEIAVGFYGRAGAGMDAIGIRCATFSDGAITGSAVDRDSYGGTGGSAVNSDGSQNCPANSYVTEVAGTNGEIFGPSDVNTLEFRYRCKDLDTGSLSGWIPSNPGWGDGTSGSNPASFGFACGSGTNSDGTYVNGFVTRSGLTLSGEALGITCQ
ncbi:hypothetical protein K2X33_11800 [bacterium]|nr:hypothetical protein [bacterium]